MPRLKMVRGFEDFWGRCGHPRSERVNAVVAWNSAIDRTCQRLAQRLGVPLEELEQHVEDLKGSFNGPR